MDSGNQTRALNNPPPKLNIIYDLTTVFRGATMYHESILAGYPRIPTMEEVTSIDPVWESDVITAHKYIEWLEEEKHLPDIFKA